MAARLTLPVVRHIELLVSPKDSDEGAAVNTMNVMVMSPVRADEE